MERTLRGLEGFPVNVGLQANARSMDPADLELLLEAGAVGFKIHEDYGAYPELIDATLRFADARDVSVSLHTDGLHETAELEDTVAAIAGRTVHAYHVEGSGGGHVPDLIALVREPNVICSSTTPTIPWGVAAVDEGAPDDDPQPRRIVRRGATTSSSSASASIPRRWRRKARSTSSARSRSSTPTRRAWAGSWRRFAGRSSSPHAMKAWRSTDAGRGHPGLPGDDASTDSTDDNARVLRYLAKVTIEPAITHGIAGHVGSLAPGPAR